MENQKEPGSLAASKCFVHVIGGKKVFKPSIQCQLHVAELSKLLTFLQALVIYIFCGCIRVANVW